MTDERIGGALWEVLAGLPPGSGIVFRHYSLAPAERLALFRRVRSIAVARRLVLVVAGVGLPWPVRHGGPQPTTAPAHDRREAVRAARKGARVLFVSPVFATRSHPGAAALGARKASAIARGLPVSAIALGGMAAQRWRRMRARGMGAPDGWAGIDAWLPCAQRGLHGR